jgi:hypothetical protein
MTARSSPAALAGQAAEAVRALNHATLPGTGGLVFPADAYDEARQLALLASRLPQALAQLLTFLRAEVKAGRVVIVSGPDAGDPAAMLAAVTGSLDAAVASCGARIHDRGGDCSFAVDAWACHAAIWYSFVSPPRTRFRRIRCSARLISGGRMGA